MACSDSITLNGLTDDDANQIISDAGDRFW